MRNRFWFLLAIPAVLALTLCLAKPVAAQSAPAPTVVAQAQRPAAAAPAEPAEAVESPTAGLPDHIKRQMRAVDPMTLRAEGISLRLWGVKPAQTSETPLELKALDLMDTLIQEG